MVQEYSMTGRQQKLSPWAIAGEPVHDKRRGTEHNIFWLYLYSVRHLVTKSKYANLPISFNKFCPDLKHVIDTYEEFIERVITYYDPFGNWTHRDLRSNMIAFLMVFHNEKHPELENIIYDPRYINSLTTYELYLNFLSELTEAEYNSLNVLHELAYQYGFYVWDLFYPETYCRVSNFDTFLIECIQANDNFVYPYIDGFLKKDTINRKEYIKTEYLNGVPVETKYKSKHTLFVYINPSDESVTFNKIKHNVEIGIAKAQKGKKPDPIGDQSTAKILIRIDVKSKSFSENDALRTIGYAIEGYRFIFNGPGLQFMTILRTETSDGMDTSQLIKINKKHNAKVKKMADIFKSSISLPYEQRDPTSRAIGIWLWDKVHFSDKPMTQAKAIDEILKRKLPASYDMSLYRNIEKQEDIKRTLRKEYQLACRCIERMEVLPSLSK